MLIMLTPEHYVFQNKQNKITHFFYHEDKGFFHAYPSMPLQEPLLTPLTEHSFLTINHKNTVFINTVSDSPPFHVNKTLLTQLHAPCKSLLTTSEIIACITSTHELTLLSRHSPTEIQTIKLPSSIHLVSMHNHYLLYQDSYYHLFLMDLHDQTTTQIRAFPTSKVLHANEYHSPLHYLFTTQSEYFLFDFYTHHITPLSHPSLPPDTTFSLIDWLFLFFLGDEVIALNPLLKRLPFQTVRIHYSDSDSSVPFHPRDVTLLTGAQGKGILITSRETPYSFTLQGSIPSLGLQGQKQFSTPVLTIFSFAS